ncbi:nucleotide exchange factor GrpE [Minwuia thermotolerans]|uniref:Protein GrpE n=1 Tax=Minwuia thermotolerans TaxID=2056226 RepID=A0A2M9FZ20_9PROT|nr:nucleotide exchange factor GrpE [Minwuia thermotolerans]PJK28717.1 nucleotide exchange factor GrpE [Minwuia thermotolerans]
MMQEDGKKLPEDKVDESRPTEEIADSEDAAAAAAEQAANDMEQEPDAPAAPPENEVAGEPDELAVLTEENASLKDRLVRTLADLENTRKRAQRDREDAQKFAVQKFARDMCEVADNLQRAIDAAPEEGADENTMAVLEGVKITRAALQQIFERHGIRVIEARDQKFDPNLHEAMTEIDVPGAPPGICIEVIETGYTLNGRLLRPARVVVTKAQSRSAGQRVDTQA